MEQETKSHASGEARRLGFAVAKAKEKSALRPEEAAGYFLLIETLSSWPSAIWPDAWEHTARPM